MYKDKTIECLEMLMKGQCTARFVGRQSSITTSGKDQYLLSCVPDVKIVKVVDKIK